jgi:hypothetical protein
LIFRKKLWEGLAKKQNLAITSFAKKENNLCHAKINAKGQRSNILSKDEPTSS